MDHPFDRYGALTDVDALKKSTDTPLRKCIRVNTHRMSVERFLEHSRRKKWVVDRVPWCEEGFFLDREDRSIPLGKDLRHLLGCYYVQEASSMLPAALLDAKPGDAVLDMAAAPGSKTTQISATVGATGFVFANDMQEKRLQTLKSAVQRLGCSNVNIFKHMGQWYGYHMTEQFDRVLCDAPCTAQGTARKDRDALTYSSDHSVGKAAKLQRELLQSAIDACKVGGRVVYSTCTLTPEENEEVVLSILRKNDGKIAVIDPTPSMRWDVFAAIDNSHIVQKNLGCTEMVPMFRLWPQTYDTEGFFCAVFEKISPTCDRAYFDWQRPTEEALGKNDSKTIRSMLTDVYGTDFLLDGEIIARGREDVRICNGRMLEFGIPSRNYSSGISFYKELKSKYELRLTSELAECRGHMASSNVLDLSPDELKSILAGQDVLRDRSDATDMLLKHDGLCIGLGTLRSGRLKNKLSRDLILHGAVI